MKAKAKPAAEQFCLQLTIEEQDRVNACKERIRGCLGAIEVLDGDVEIPDLDVEIARGVQYDVMREALDSLDETLKAATGGGR